MIADSLISDEVWADAPEDNEEAFLYIATAAYERLKHIRENDSARGQHELIKWRQQYIWELCAVADKLQISGLPSPESSISTTTGMADFDAYLARLITTIKAGKRASLRSDTVTLSFQTKTDIRAHLEELRAKINASNLSASDQAALHKKVDAVEAELENKRSSLRPFWALAGGLAMAGCTAVGALADLPSAAETIGQIVSKVHAERAAEIEAEARFSQPLLGHQATLRITDQVHGD